MLLKIKMKIFFNTFDIFSLSREYYKLINFIGVALEDQKSLNFLPPDLKDLGKKN